LFEPVFAGDNSDWATTPDPTGLAVTSAPRTTIGI